MRINSTDSTSVRDRKEALDSSREINQQRQERARMEWKVLEQERLDKIRESQKIRQTEIDHQENSYQIKA